MLNAMSRSIALAFSGRLTGHFCALTLSLSLSLSLDIYRVTHFNRRTRISRNLSQIEKNGSDKSYRGQRGPHNGANVFDLELDL